MRQSELVVQPDDGIAPTLNAIRHAKQTIDLTIFRFDQHDVASALEAAVTRGVHVRALIANSNRGGVHHLRRLEWRLLEAGVVVGRSNHDLERYHAKLMIVDKSALHVYGFNFTRADLSSRSFGIITPARRLVHQAMALFEADLAHRAYEGAGDEGLVVSPENARERLEAFVQGAQHELLIYDSKLGDRRVLRLLAERARAGVSVRIIGHVGKDAGKGSRHAARYLEAPDERHLERFFQGSSERATADSRRSDGRPSRQPDERRIAGVDSPGTGHPAPGGDVCIAKLRHRRMHLRAIIRDGKTAFVGSQSLRRAELDARREVGVFVHERDVVREIRDTFERDWPSDDASLVETADA